MNLDFPFRFDRRGRTATTAATAAGTSDHIRDMVEQLLFTSPGERVNRPEFGSGLMQLVFAPNSPELAGAVEFTVRAALDRWLGDLIEVTALEATAAEGTLTVAVTYTERRTGLPRSETFTRAAP